MVHKALEFDPARRYQHPSELLQEARIVLERLEAGDTQSLAQPADGDGQVIPDASTEGANRVIMLIESKIEFQDLIREKLKKRGYRVLIISDPQRALSRFVPDDNPPADCVLFSAPELGASVLDAFNQFASDPHTADIPAILLVDRKQQYIIRNAKTGPNRLMLAVPIKVRELRAAVLKLLKQRAAGEVA